MVERNQGRGHAGFLAALALAVPEGVLLVDPETLVVLWANPVAGSMLGVDSAELVGRSTPDLQHADDAELTRVHQSQRDARVWHATRRVRHADGGYRLLDCTAADRSDDPDIGGLVILLRDASERHQAWETERRVKALVEHAQDAVLVYGPDLRIVYANPANDTIMDDLDGTLVEHIERAVDPGQRDAAVAAAGELLAGPGNQVELLLRVERTDGVANWVDVRATNLLDDPAVAGIVLNGRIVTEQVELERRLREAALRDPLTGLPNRAAVVERLQAMLDGGPSSVVVLFLDLDRFKVVNDSFGHVTGDAVLAELAGRLGEAVGPDAVVGRFGGDEFVVVASIDGAGEAVDLAQTMAAAASRPFPCVGPEGEQAEVYLSGSVGIALGSPGSTPSSLLHHADAAMYRAKEQGRGTWELYDEGMRRAALSRLTLESELARALDDGGFELWYQPIVDIAAGRLRGFEALARWRHRERGLVSPLEFIPVAEDTGGIHRLGAWALATATAELRAWQDLGIGGAGGLGVSVNMSPRQLGRESLAGDVAELLAGNGIAPERVTLEITESLLVDDLDSAVKALDRLRDVGVRLALDDFGTGWSSLTYLRSVPVDAVKIDSSFIQGLTHSADDRAIVAAVVAMCRALGKSVVAEGVEVEGQLQALREIGCTHAQGYLFSRPIPAADVPTWIARFARAGNRDPDA